MRFERPITPQMVSAECERRILSRYPLTKQINAAARAGDAGMRAWIEAMIARCHEIEAMTPIPADFNRDERWPG